MRLNGADNVPRSAFSGSQTCKFLIIMQFHSASFVAFLLFFQTSNFETLALLRSSSNQSVFSATKFWGLHFWTTCYVVKFWSPHSYYVRELYKNVTNVWSENFFIKKYKFVNLQKKFGAQNISRACVTKVIYSLYNDTDKCCLQYNVSQNCYFVSNRCIW